MKKVLLLVFLIWNICVAESLDSIIDVLPNDYTIGDIKIGSSHICSIKIYSDGGLYVDIQGGNTILDSKSSRFGNLSCLTLVQALQELAKKRETIMGNMK
ncbi:hypothetical protein [uncultured Helicobacter sp.]|uniref:hypothetical protein n=1 Tax=uncultured Helicobacter sp. TaxID=175537 RepID=UPI001C3A7433|nr:hypothetical protein [Candidatus Helicobacter avicola]